VWQSGELGGPSSAGQRGWISPNGNSRRAFIVMRLRSSRDDAGDFCREMLERK
jgi:hypothetical protein